MNEPVEHARAVLEDLASTAVGERKALASAALANLDRLATLPLTAEVRLLTLREMEKIATLPETALAPDSAVRKEFAAITELRRFVGGQLHWDVGGVPKSFLLKMTWRDALRAIAWVRRAGGWYPWFDMHLPSRGAPFLIPAEYRRSYLRMAACMELQPEIRGAVGGSWLHAEETMEITPHLRWLNDLFLENGGLLLHLGPASIDSGFLVGSKKRQELYEAGKYRPRNAVFLWPREALLEWARRQLNS
jgi:hypothetical protein